jgi:hypothetical protein
MKTKQHTHRKDNRKASDIDSIIDDLGYIDFDEIKAPA